MIAIIHKGRLFLTLLISVYFVYPLLWTSYLVGLWTLLSVILLIINWKKIERRDMYNTMVLISPFVLLLIMPLIYDGNHSKIIERALSFLVFPIGIFLGRQQLKTDEWKLLSRFFIGGIVILCLRGIIQFFIQPYQHVYTEHHDFIFRYRNEFNTNTGISPTYASIYVVFGVSILVLEGIKKILGRVLGIMVLLFLFANLFLLSAKMPIISLGVVGIIWLLTGRFTLPSKHRKRWVALMIIVGFGLATIFMLTRWSEVVTFLQYSTSQTKENSVGIRKLITQCNMELVATHFWDGVGPLNVQQELNRCYYQFEGDDFSRHTFNSHNQYFDYWLAYGITGLVMLMVVTIYPLWKGVKRKDFLLITFSVLTILCMLTENILSRQSGVVFYCFFYALLLNRGEGNKKTSELGSEVS